MKDNVILSLEVLKRPWCWEKLKVGGEGDDRGWDGWMASPTQWTWVWVDSGSWWWTGRPGVLQFMGSQRVRHDWVTELNWRRLTLYTLKFFFAILIKPCIVSVLKNVCRISRGIPEELVSWYFILDGYYWCFLELCWHSLHGLTPKPLLPSA